MQLLRLIVALLYLWATAFASAEESQTRNGHLLPARKQIRTRDQLLSAVNGWLEEHRQLAWTMDDLIGRTAVECYSFRQGDNPIWGVTEDFLVGLIKNQPFKRALTLRSARVESFQFKKTKKRFAVPSHDSLALDILATETDLHDKHINWAGVDHWRIGLATALTGKPLVKRPVKKHLEKNKSDTPQEVLDSLNAARREFRLADFSRDELAATLVDKIAVIEDREGLVSPEVVSFFECFLANKKFETEVDEGGFESCDHVVTSSNDEELFFTKHWGFEIVVREHPYADNIAIPVAHIVVSNYTSKRK